MPLPIMLPSAPRLPNPSNSDSGTAEGDDPSPLPLQYSQPQRTPMPSFRVVTTDEVPEVLGEFPNLAYTDMFAEALMHQRCQRSTVEHWDGREWVSL
jgi:hypothetical protein